MKISQEFKFLKVESLKRKDSGDTFYIVRLIDEDCNPIRLFSFNESVNTQLTKDINEGKLKQYQNILFDLYLSQSDKGWNVRINNYSLKY